MKITVPQIARALLLGIALSQTPGIGALAQGIGTSEVEHVLATQTLRQQKSKNMRVTFTGAPIPGVGPKDYALAMIGERGVVR